MSQLNWYPFCFANKFVNSESNSIKCHNLLEWSIVEFSWKFNRVLSTGSKVMQSYVQIWTNKFWTYQHVKDTLIAINNYDVISVAKYQFLWIFEELCCGCQFGLLDSIRVLQQHKHFHSTRCAWHITTIPFRLFADPVVSTLAINQSNDWLIDWLIDIFVY